MALNLFSGGYLPLEQRCQAENLYWAILVKLKKIVGADGRRARGPAGARRCDGRHVLLQLLAVPVVPDSWAIKQLFPVMPIHRLNTPPTHHAVLGDITCDSDGKIDQFIDRRDVKRTLPLHTVNGDPYYLGVFLVGAYQEILGDLHNLFGDTHAVHVSLDERGNVVLDAVIKGDTVKEVLDYVEFDSDTLVRKLRHDVELAVREGKITLRGVRPPAGVLRGRSAGLHLPRRSQGPLTAWPPLLPRGSCRLAEPIERLPELRRNHVGGAALNLAPLHHVNQLAVPEKSDGG